MMVVKRIFEEVVFPGHSPVVQGTYSGSERDLGGTLVSGFAGFSVDVFFLWKVKVFVDDVNAMRELVEKAFEIYIVRLFVRDIVICVRVGGS